MKLLKHGHEGSFRYSGTDTTHRFGQWYAGWESLLEVALVPLPGEEILLKVGDKVEFTLLLDSGSLSFRICIRSLGDVMGLSLFATEDEETINLPPEAIVVRGSLDASVV